VAEARTQRTLAHVPGVVRLPGPIMRALLRAGIQIGPNWLVTCRGRISGEPRTQALAVLAFGGKRFVVGTFGDVNWCRNLRANPDATIQLGRRHERVTAVELDTAAAETFFRDQLMPGLPSMPLLDRLVTSILVRSVASDIVYDPRAAALHRPVFELRPREA